MNLISDSLFSHRLYWDAIFGFEDFFNYCIRIKITIFGISRTATFFQKIIIAHFLLDDRAPWIQVDFKTPTKVTGIKTQGRSNADWWVKHYSILYGNEIGKLSYIKRGGRKAVSMIYLV